MLGLGKIIIGSFLLGLGLILCFTIIGIIFALPVFSAGMGLMTAGFAEFGFKTLKVANKLSQNR